MRWMGSGVVEQDGAPGIGRDCQNASLVYEDYLDLFRDPSPSLPKSCLTPPNTREYMCAVMKGMLVVTATRILRGSNLPEDHENCRCAQSVESRLSSQ